MKYMRIKNLLTLTLFIIVMSEPTHSQEKLKYYNLTNAESAVIDRKGTERPFSGKYNNNKEKGTYLCKKCGSALYYSDFKFNSECGWPSFDDEIANAVRRLPYPDGMRTEIECASCSGHLGHVFTGEGFTSKNIRHCVNSVSLDFVPVKLPAGRYGQALFAGGCFWGVEYYLQKASGVLAVVSGYSGGHVKNPSYREVCTGTTGHAETVKVVYDPSKTSYDKLLRLFMEIHDPTQVGRQGPDIGDQYRSAIFYMNEDQKKTAEVAMEALRTKGYSIATSLEAASEFYVAEAYHQDYYFSNGQVPYCHSYVKRF